MGRVLRPILSFAAFAVLTPFAGPIVGALGASLVDIGLQSAGVGVNRRRPTLAPFDPKSINPDPAAPRKLVLGRTAFPVDLRYAEPSGTNQRYVDYVFALAAHRSDAIEEIYIEDDLAWTSGGGAQGKYAGFLTVEVITEAGPSAFHTVNAGATWNSTTRLTGCTTMKVRVDRQGDQSPFGSGINGRWAVIGRGMPVYDPAQDSTQPGGSGPQRANDRSTWAYTAGTVRGNNPALQLLAYLLGWTINGVRSVGVGLSPDVLDIPSFAAAAAICDEAVGLVGGGSQRRYEAGRAFSDADDPLGVCRVLLDAMNGELVDDGGRLGLRLAVNDLVAAVTLTDDDFVSGYDWQPAPPIEQQYTMVRGRYSQPGAPTLYGMVDYPEVPVPRVSLAPRVLTLELSAVQDQRRAERIAKQAGARSLYQGTFRVTIGARGWLLRRNMVVAVTSSARGWTAKLFRVRALTFNANATVDVVLREENAAIYPPAAAETPVVAPVPSIVFDSRAAASWRVAGIQAGADITADAVPDLPQGSWMAGRDYRVGDLVFANNSTWTATSNHTSAAGNRPGIGPWTLAVPSPEPGVQGTAGSVSFSSGVLSSGSYGAGLATVTVTVGSGGIVDLGANGTTDLESGTSATAALKVQRETSPGVWADVGTESALPGVADDPPSLLSRSFSVTWQATGLTVGSAQNFRILARRSAGAGTVSASGLLTAAGR